MAEIRIEHLINCDQETFYGKIFFSREFNQSLYTEGLEFPSFEILELKETPSEIIRVWKVTPRSGKMPAALEKLAGDLSYREEGKFEKATRIYNLKVTPGRMAKKVTIEGELTTEPAGDGKLKRIFKLNVNAKIFGVGRLVEKQIVGDMRNSYDRSANFLNEWISKHEL